MRQATNRLNVLTLTRFCLLACLTACGSGGKGSADVTNASDVRTDADTTSDTSPTAIPCTPNNGQPYVAPECNDFSVCTVDLCDGATAAAACVHTPLPNGQGCAACGQTGTCIDGKCVAIPAICTDHDPCTADICSGSPGNTCSHVTLADGAACGGCGGAEGVCQNAKCILAPDACDDGNPCTQDFCTDQCQHVPVEVPTPCGTACGTPWACNGSACEPIGTPQCDDGNGCTVDTCDGTKGCVHTVVVDKCNDSNPCTDDMCDPADGSCAHTTLADGATCLEVPCSLCVSGVCTATKKNPCDDGDACTSDYCSIAQGCTHYSNVGKCNDNDPCTTDVYSPADASCSHVVLPDGATCGTKPCSVCLAGACTATDNPCVDGDPCTEDDCSVPGGACSHPPDLKACSPKGELCNPPCPYGTQCEAKDDCRGYDCFLDSEGFSSCGGDYLTSCYHCGTESSNTCMDATFCGKVGPGYKCKVFADGSGMPSANYEAMCVPPPGCKVQECGNDDWGGYCGDCPAGLGCSFDKKCIDVKAKCGTCAVGLCDPKSGDCLQYTGGSSCAMEMNQKCVGLVAVGCKLGSGAHYITSTDCSKYGPKATCDPSYGCQVPYPP